MTEPSERELQRLDLLGPWPTGAEDLEASHPDWMIWRSRGQDGTHGPWMAQRSEFLTPRQQTRGLRSTLTADTVDELGRLLDAQERLREQEASDG
ncbi:hypothetical protein GCM10022630_02020 [Thermobifida alba]